MEFDITRLNNNIDKVIYVNEKYSFTQEELKGTDLLKLDNVKVTGEVFKNSLGNIELSLDIEGVMVLPCAITLKPVDYPFSVNVSGEYDELVADLEENSTNFKNTIDILPIIWENILMEIPMRVVSPDAEDISLEGDGWVYNSKEEDDNNPFKELLDMNSEVK